MTKRVMIYRPILPRDCAALVRLHRRVFEGDELETSIFVAPRVENYLRHLVAFPAAQREYFLWGAWNGKALIGYVFGRALPSSWHLNFLAVAPSFQNRGIGRELYRLWREAGRERGFCEMGLNVARDNRAACAWYERLGWSTHGESWIYHRTLSPSAPRANSNRKVPQLVNPQIVNWENAQAWQACYGFSNIEISDAQKRWKIGRLGEKYFRADEILPAEIERTLHGMEPNRTLMLILPRRKAGWKNGKLRLQMCLAN